VWGIPALPAATPRQVFWFSGVGLAGKIVATDFTDEHCFFDADFAGYSLARPFDKRPMHQNTKAFPEASFVKTLRFCYHNFVVMPSKENRCQMLDAICWFFVY